MARFVRVLGYVVLSLVVLIGGAFVAARFHDGPLAMIPGGELEAGELVTAPITDWSFAAAPQEIELQLAYQDTSRTTWVVVHEGAAIVPASLSFPPGKQWPYAADRDGRAIVRIGGKRYPVNLTRVQDPALEAKLGESIRAKYPSVPPSGGGVWFFRLASRAE